MPSVASIECADQILNLVIEMIRGQGSRSREEEVLQIAELVDKSKTDLVNAILEFQQTGKFVFYDITTLLRYHNST